MATPLTDVRALSALVRLVGDTAHVAAIVAAYGTWGDLVAATPYERLHTLGPWAGNLAVPATCPPMPAPGAGVVVTGRFDPAYPGALAELTLSPPLLYRRGALPEGPLVAVGGVHHPSASALRRARTAGAICGRQGLSVVALVETAIGRAALDGAVREGGTAVAVASSSLGALSAREGLLERILAGGGASVSVCGPEASWSEQATVEAATVAAALASVVVVPEFGAHAAGGLGLVEAALGVGRSVVACLPGPDGIPLWASTLLVRGRRLLDADGRLDLPAELTRSERAVLRALVGDPLADVVVGDADELAAAIAAAVGGR